MAFQVKIPAAGESINSATVGQWHQSDGAQVAKGDVLATIETDKVSTELEAEADGTLVITVKEGEEVAIGTVIGEIKEGVSKTNPAAPAEAPPTQEPAIAMTVPSNGSKSAEGAIIEIKVPPAGESIATATIAQWHRQNGDTVSKGETLVTLETDKISAEIEAEGTGELKVSAAEGDEVAIGAVIGTIAVSGEAPAAPASSSVPAPAVAVTPELAPPAPVAEAVPEPARQARLDPAAETRLVPDLHLQSLPPPEEKAPEPDDRTTRKRMTSLRRKIAAQLVSAQQTAAILSTFNEADMSAIMKLRKTVQEDFIAKHGVKLGFMSFFVKAVVQALKEVPSINGRIDGDEIVANHFFDIGIAVGTEKGLIVPVVRDADSKSFADIERDIIGYATKAKERKIQLEDLQGGVFTISNGGVYGSLLSTPILNPPQSGILGMHTIQQRPVAVDGKVEIRPMMYLALSYDHRLVDGKEAVTFLISIKESIENPTRLMLEL